MVRSIAGSIADSIVRSIVRAEESGPSGDGILLEDGTSFIKLENDTDYVLKE